MNSETPKKNAEPDPVRLVEASEGLHEFVAEFADGSPLTPRESRKPRAQRVQEPLLLWSDAPLPSVEADPDLALRDQPAATPDVKLGVGLDERWDVSIPLGWVRLAGGVALGALVLSVIAAGIVMLRRSPAPSLADLPAPAAHTDVARLDTSTPPAPVLALPTPRTAEPDRVATVDRRSPQGALMPAFAGPGSVGPASNVPRPSQQAVRTPPAKVAEKGPATKQSPAPVVAWLRPEAPTRTAPAAGTNQSAARPTPGAQASTTSGPSVAAAPPRAPSAPAPVAPPAPRAAASPAPAAPVASPASVAPVTPPAVGAAPVAAADVPPRATVATAAVPEPSPSAAVAPPPTVPAAPAGPNRLRALPRAASAESPVAVAPAPSKREVDTHAIEALLGRYRNGYNSLSASSVSAVWPTVDEKNLAKAFERIEDQHVSFDSCEIEIGGVAAEAACRGTARYVPKVGNRTPRDEARRWRFNLRRASDGWVIDRVVAQ